MIKFKHYCLVIKKHSKQPTRTETAAEEAANSISHGIGAGLSVAALVVMIYLAKTHDAWHVVSVSLFGASLILLYLTSCLYHAISNPKVKSVFKILDHSFIYVLIAGSYMPWLLVSIRGTLGWWLFGIVCGLMVTGIIIKSAFPNRFTKLGLFLYIAMGWLICLGLKQIIDQTTTIALVWLVLGGVAYTAGVIFFLKQKKFAHFIWHLFVMGGSSCHVAAVIFGLLIKT